MKIKLLILSMLFCATSVMAQTGQGEYLEAKRLFEKGEYRNAQNAFSALTTDPYFGTYSSFYFALSAYQQGNVKVAVDMWTQLQQQVPNWDKKNEITFWLAYAYFESEQFDKALNYVEKMNREEQVKIGGALIRKFITPKPLQMIKVLHDQHGENEALGRVYYEKLNDLPYSKRDFKEINRLDEKWSFASNGMSLELLPLVKKDKYRIGVLLPFVYDSTNLDLVFQNTIVMDLYQGMVLACKQLKDKGVNLELVAYDTKKSGAVTQSILNSLPPDYLDLIVGPLYAEPVKLVKAYSSENGVNMINPLSSTWEVISNNPYGYLFKPSQETMALKLAEYADKNLSNKNVMIFYEGTERDSIFAATYKEAMQQAGFSIIRYQELTQESAKEVLDELIEQKEVYYTKAEADSLLLLNSGRFIKEKRLRPADVERAEKYPYIQNNKYHPRYLPVSYDDNNRAVTYYENVLLIGKDSIGHILGATSKNFLANNLISAVETMGDSTILFGYGSWLDFTMLSYTQLERINATLVHPDYIDDSNVSYQSIKKNISSTYKIEPSLYHFLGYEMISQIGRLMKTNGVYFQRGLVNDRFYEGQVLQGIKYGTANDNQVVPLVKFEKAELKIVNKDSYEN